MDLERIHRIVNCKHYSDDKINSLQNKGIKFEELMNSNNSDVLGTVDNSIGDIKKVTNEEYGAERYLMCNPNMLYSYSSRSIKQENSYKVNKTTQIQAEKKYGHNRNTRGNK